MFKHLTYSDREYIEKWCNNNIPIKEIAKRLDKHISTIYREIKRGQYVHRNSEYIDTQKYSSYVAERKYREHLAAKGADLKISNDHKLAAYIEHKIIKHKYSPDAVVGEIRRKNIKFNTAICTSTLYSYIDKGIFFTLTNKHLPERGKRKRVYNKVIVKRPPRGESIENRPSVINDRLDFGHWEMDTVHGTQGTFTTLLVLSERLTRREIIVRIPDRTSNSVVLAINDLENRFGSRFSKVFKTITVDNGSEFCDIKGIERNGRTKLYFCHPNCSFERGTNENINRMIRRFIPKKTDIGKYSVGYISKIENWINNYPRKILDYCTSNELFNACLAAL